HHFQNGGNLIVGYTNEPLHIFNPIILFSAYAYLMNALTYESLVQWNQNLGIIPDLATSYTISPNGTVYTFNLRQNVSWVQYVNGQVVKVAPFTAQDVKFTYAVILNQSASAGFFFSPLAEPSTQTLTGVTLNNSMVSIPNNYTIIFHLSQPFAPFLLYAATSPLLSQAVLQGQNLTTDSYINQHIVGTGPFVVSQYAVGSHVTMAANPYYWGGRPHLDSITFQVFQTQAAAEIALKTGAINYVESVPSQDIASLNSTSGIVVRTEPSWNLEYVGYNLNPNLADGSFNPLSIPQVREAISYAVNVSQVVQAAYGKTATPVDQVWIPFFAINGHSLTNSSIKSNPYDLAQANLLLNQSGYLWTPNGGNVSNGNPNRFSISVVVESGNQPELTMIQVIQTMLSQVGINVVIKLEEPSVATQDIAGAPQPKGWNAYLSHISESPDPDFMAYLFLNSPGNVGSYGGNWGNYNNSAVNQIVLAAENTVNDTQRALLYQQLSGILASQYAWLWLDNPLEVVAHSSNFHGFVYGPEGPSAGVQGALSPFSLMNVTYSPAQTSTFTTSSSTSSTSATSSTSSTGSSTSSSASSSSTSPGGSISTTLIIGIVVVLVVIVVAAIALTRRKKPAS
ncbi:MAG: ABC transporter substrate-binding protein, partial [Thaumarchaeota archaeon]|nr:ABC transporter substrate-binding protein [Nitrososphaerota archaeon]